MIESTHILAFNLTLIASMLVPGPALLYALRQSIAGGFAMGAATGFGLATMATSWTLAALLGLEALFVAFPYAFVALKVIGALYLMWIAFGLWRNASAPMSTETSQHRRAFVGGLLINLANPKSVLFSASVVVVIFPPGLTAADIGLILANNFAIEAGGYLCFAALLATPPARSGYLKLKPVFERVAAMVLGLLGLRLLFSR
ncbi:LysE family transporter [Octadecabacter sp. G9-8]|uniref:LysE family transporter n=1 Tax=Octadecabacter dasysiphoniae TaxID=2909341 RepID=A0ABS9D0H6_9RHOB|nr:LysE family transporter [Octadecabacter dasysiphoniae]MCF2872822.1 LysE family transporter [Octadecabacter dasysiphoniae]